MSYWTLLFVVWKIHNLLSTGPHHFIARNYSSTFCCGDISVPLLHAWLKF